MVLFTLVTDNGGGIILIDPGDINLDPYLLDMKCNDTDGSHVGDYSSGDSGGVNVGNHVYSDNIDCDD